MENLSFIDGIILTLIAILFCVLAFMSGLTYESNSIIFQCNQFNKIVIDSKNDFECKRPDNARPGVGHNLWAKESWRRGTSGGPRIC
mgnify:CR=1 FL=1